MLAITAADAAFGTGKTVARGVIAAWLKADSRWMLQLDREFESEERVSERNEFVD